jgi:hypothetical protein
MAFFSILLVRKLRRLDVEWRPREGFEKCEQVCFFFLCQTKWLHEVAQIRIGPTAFVEKIDDFFQVQEDPIVHIGCGFEDAAQGGGFECAFIPILACS